MFVDHALFLMSGTYSLRITSGTCWKSPVWGILDYQIILNSHLWKLVGHLLPSISTVLFYLFSFFFMAFCCFICIYSLGHAMQHMGILVPGPGNPCLLHWEQGVLTTGLLGKSLQVLNFEVKSFLVLVPQYTLS